jgi:hypothetical protein
LTLNFRLAAGLEPFHRKTGPDEIHHETQGPVQVTRSVSGRGHSQQLGHRGQERLSFHPAILPPGPNSALAGTWVNTNGATKNVVDLVVGTSAKGITVDGFGACSPQACQLPRSAGLSRAGIRSSMTADAPWQARCAAWPRGARPR